MKKFDCPFQTPEEQVETLKKNWLVIAPEDISSIKKFLTVVPYIHIFGYYHELLKNKKEGDMVNCKELLNLFYFDEALRLTFLKYIPYIELDLKSKLVNETYKYYGDEIWRTNQENYKTLEIPDIFFNIKDAIDKYWIVYNSLKLPQDKEHNLNNKKQTIKELENRLINGVQYLTKKYIDLYIERYNDPKYPPIWNLMEELTFWEVNMLCKELPNQVMDKITNSYDLWPIPYKSAIKNIIDLRNCCCHNNMLFNKMRQLPKALKEKLLEKKYTEKDEKYYPLYYIYSLTHFFLVQLNPNIAQLFLEDVFKLLMANSMDYLLFPRKNAETPAL